MKQKSFGDEFHHRNMTSADMTEELLHQLQNITSTAEKSNLLVNSVKKLIDLKLR